MFLTPCACGVAVRVLEATYEDSPLGHSSFGRLIGQTFAADMAQNFAHDNELHSLLNFTSVNPKGRQLLQALTQASQTAFPNLMLELQGMSDGSGLSLAVLQVNNFREELVQVSHHRSIPPLHRSIPLIHRSTFAAPPHYRCRT